jgi:hypothetical protein
MNVWQVISSILSDGPEITQIGKKFGRKLGGKLTFVKK